MHYCSLKVNQIQAFIKFSQQSLIKCRNYECKSIKKGFSSNIALNSVEFKNIIFQLDNRMAAIDKVLQVSNNKYPFGDYPCFSLIRVEQKHFFTSSESMLEKKSEMLRKQQMISNPGIIRLLSLSAEGKILTYQWEYVPHSLSSYIRTKFVAEKNEIWEMTKKLLIKKVTFQVTVLMSFLAKMRIQTELSSQTIGISLDEKVKLYLSPRSKMGIRSELFLISQYGQAKQRILKELQGELQLIRNNPENPNFKGTRPYFESKMMNGSLTESILSDSVIKIEPKISKIEDKQEKKVRQQPLKRKMSIGNFDLSSLTGKSQHKSQLRSSRTPKPHKYSFQLNSSQNLNDESLNQSCFQKERERFLNHSKSIKIELEQNQIVSPQRKRKDSYKVKITTCRQYEVNDPQQLFNQNGDIFEFFAAKAKKEEEEFSQEESFDTHQEQQKYGLNTTAPFTPPPSPLLTPTRSSHNLQERLKEARQRSQKMLKKIRLMKK